MLVERDERGQLVLREHGSLYTHPDVMLAFAAGRVFSPIYTQPTLSE